MKDVFVHPSAFVDEPSEIGAGTYVWHFVHVMKNVKIGEKCSLGQNVFVASGVTIGKNVKIQNNVSIYEGVELEDNVFCGPSCVFTNVTNPRSEIVRKGQYSRTVVKRGASIGANATIVCGSTLGRYSFVAAGSLVTKQEVPDYALMMGVPAKQKGFVSRHGHRLIEEKSPGIYECPESKWRYQKQADGTLVCLDWPEDKPLA